MPDKMTDVIQVVVFRRSMRCKAPGCGRPFEEGFAYRFNDTAFTHEGQCTVAYAIRQYRRNMRDVAPTLVSGRY